MNLYIITLLLLPIYINQTLQAAPNSQLIKFKHNLISPVTCFFESRQKDLTSHIGACILGATSGFAVPKTADLLGYSNAAIEVATSPISPFIDVTDNTLQTLLTLLYLKETKQALDNPSSVIDHISGFYTLTTISFLLAPSGPYDEDMKTNIIKNCILTAFGGALSAALLKRITPSPQNSLAWPYLPIIPYAATASIIATWIHHDRYRSNTNWQHTFTAANIANQSLLKIFSGLRQTFTSDEPPFTPLLAAIFRNCRGCTLTTSKSPSLLCTFTRGMSLGQTVFLAHNFIKNVLNSKTCLTDLPLKEKVLLGLMGGSVAARLGWLGYQQVRDIYTLSKKE